jgi:alkylation response protein AidB-like acyl-CoA dehydrogenase
VSEHDPLDIRGQERAEAEKKLRERLAQEAEEADIRRLMTSKWGRRFLWRLMDQAGVFRLSYAPDAMAMAFAEGNRNSGLRILNLIHTLCPEHYPAMLKEQTSERTEHDGDPSNDK